MTKIGNIITKNGIIWPTILVTILCTVASVLISLVIGHFIGTTDLHALLVAAVICPTLVAPPVVYFYARLTIKLDKSKQEQEGMNKGLTQLNLELNNALKKVKLMSGLLTICSICKKIRDDRGYWNKIESFIKERSTADFVRGFCPECAKIYPGMNSPEKTDAHDV